MPFSPFTYTTTLESVGEIWDPDSGRFVVFFFSLDYSWALCESDSPLSAHRQQDIEIGRYLSSPNRL